jgi:hypothetical protein
MPSVRPQVIAAGQGGRPHDGASLPALLASPRLCWILALAGGALAAILTLGPRILDIRDTGWLLHGTLGPDPVAYWLAWRYFAPSAWAWPPGLNPDYGLELSSAIFYVDAVPAAAFIAKALRPLVVIPQYWGPWLVLCAVLQAGLAWRLLGLAVRDPITRLLGALLFAFQPLLLNRFGGHFALASQWALLWALWLCLREDGRRQTLQWAGLFGLVSMLNPYVLAMCSGLWVADLVTRTHRAGRLAGAVLQAAIVPLAGVCGLYLAGYFTVSGQVAPMGVHYGHAQFDLTAPFDGVEWGRLLPALPGLRHWEHGGSYLGAGVLLMLAIGLGLALRGGVRPHLRRHPMLLLALLGMLAFAISNRVAIAGHLLFEFNLPARIAHFADMLRASERFFWPLAYTAIFASVALVATRLPQRRARIVLAAALLLQLVDVDAGMARFRALVAAAPSVAADRLPDPFWAQAALRYGRVRAVPAANFGADWEPVARFAARHRLPTDSVYLSRVDEDALQRLNRRTTAEFVAGRWVRGTLYILRTEAMRQRAARFANPARDLLTVVNGITVFAPGWHAR